jgi:hypothetical protein
LIKTSPQNRILHFGCKPAWDANRFLACNNIFPKR